MDARAVQDGGFCGQWRGWANGGRHEIGGRGGIRTHEGLTPLAVFKTAALNHSATLPCLELARLFCSQRRTNLPSCKQIANIWGRRRVSVVQPARRYQLRQPPRPASRARRGCKGPV